MGNGMKPCSGCACAGPHYSLGSADVFIGSLKAAILHAKAVADVAASTYNTSS